MRRSILTAVFLACLAVPALAQQPVPVGTIVAAKQPVSKAIEFVGRIEAIDRVELRARVSGYLNAVLFTEGETVKDGEKLFQIDPAPFEAAVMRARGALLQAQGAYANASLQRQRAQELVKTRTEAQATLDQRIADEKSAQGAVVRADADLKTAQLDLGYLP